MACTVVAPSQITYCPPMPARGVLADEYVGGARPAYPVEAHLVAGGDVESTGITFDDYQRMGTMQQKLDSGRHLATPTWVLNDAHLRSVLVHYLEERALVNPAPELSEVERIHRAQQALQAEVPKKDALLTRLAKEYVDLKRAGGDVRKLGTQIEGLDTVLVVTKDIASKVLMVAHLYYRLGRNSVEVGNEVGMKPPHVRMMLMRLRVVAHKLGLGEAPRGYIVKTARTRWRRVPKTQRKTQRKTYYVRKTKSRQEIISSPEFIVLFEQCRGARTHCKHGHPVTIENASIHHVQHGLWACYVCILARIESSRARISESTPEKSGMPELRRKRERSTHPAIKAAAKRLRYEVVIQTAAFKNALAKSVAAHPEKTHCFAGHDLVNAEAGHIHCGDLIRTGRRNCKTCWKKQNDAYVARKAQAAARCGA